MLNIKQTFCFAVGFLTTGLLALCIRGGIIFSQILDTRSQNGEPGRC